ncbi:membrane protein [Mycolicibacterium aromaticivorans JS19b1 = JCM 16368]|uniref:Membrane protein n=1 Tax=Mycolicibacterium aromaticivorans JS19b1 = JCM 16368 TaxID=1440774 RepID=A0A064CMR1_9MYCO|nr:alpha/beta hydrolase-fold protein [Mycolicibacterium aromaticivorans]KDF01641.1 membrane protein [Mycolicibacterium aromaticivorans JS19b1 = JCM 16368]
MRHFIGHLSLIHGWLPTAVQTITAVVLGCAINWRSRRWRRLWLPVSMAGGVALAAWAHWYIDGLGVAGDPAPPVLWVWIAAIGLAVGGLALGWRSTRWWRRGLAVLAVPLCVLSAALAVNLWVGYFPTAHTAWNQLTAGPLPDQIDRATVTMMQLEGVRPAKGVVVPVAIPDNASGFHHRRELVYLPPAWFDSNPAPRLPTVMMIGSALNTPADWLRAGHAIHIVDDFAAVHGGNAPVLVFVDATGAFDNDTECVNGSRGNAADHLTKDVVPYLISNFRVSADRANWGILGWSMGGTCAVDLTVMHPDMFSAFVDIAGDIAPNVGDKTQTIGTLFGGNADAYAAFDPGAVITSHGHYSAVTGWFDIPGNPQPQHRSLTEAGMDVATDGVHDPAANPEGQDLAANTLCGLGSAHGIRCTVVTQPGRHDWPFAAQAFGAALPWLAGRLGTPGVPRVPLPGLTPQAASPPGPSVAMPSVQAAGK